MSSAQAGGAYVMFGQSDGEFSAEYSLADSPDIDGVTTFLGLAEEDSLGLAVGSAGDLNGDGVGDLWVRSPKSRVRSLSWCLLEAELAPEIHFFAEVKLRVTLSEEQQQLLPCNLCSTLSSLLLVLIRLIAEP